MDLSDDDGRRASRRARPGEIVFAGSRALHALGGAPRRDFYVENKRGRAWPTRAWRRPAARLASILGDRVEDQRRECLTRVASEADAAAAAEAAKRKTTDGAAVDRRRSARRATPTSGLIGARAAVYRPRRATGVPRDLTKCLACYREAAALGSAEAEYAVALFLLSGGSVPQDLKEGAARLRSAADKGDLGAKVYLANLYELGVHYARDPEKADVWYRSAARGAGIQEAPGTQQYN